MRSGNSQLACSYDGCLAVFRRNDHLKRHERKHSGERPYVCSIEGCNSSFTCRSYLTKHMSRPHGQDVTLFNVDLVKPKREYSCTECLKSFKTRFALKTHSFVHSGEKPFKCEHEGCHKSFVLKSKLRQHERLHVGYKCVRTNVGNDDGHGHASCSYVSYKWSDMRRHIADVHSHIHECQVCHKTFKKAPTLKHHLVTHEQPQNRPIFICTFPECNRSYYKKANLQAHVRRAHQEQVFKCTLQKCEKVFLHKKSLNNHLEWHKKPKTDIKKKNAKPKEVSSELDLKGCAIIDDSMAPGGNNNLGNVCPEKSNNNENFGPNNEIVYELI